MVSGFRLIDQLAGWSGGGQPWDVSAVAFGWDSQRQLQITISTTGETAQITFDDPVSFRVHDERELLPYWRVRDREGVGVGLFYQIDDSTYLEELLEGLSGLQARPNHYLIAAETCVEVIAYAPPTVAR